MKVAFCIPDMIIGGVENVFIRTVDKFLEEAHKNQDTDIDVCILTHEKILEPVYSEWFKNHKNLFVYTCYPLQNFFESLKKYTNFFPLKHLRKLTFSFYKKYRRLVFRHKFDDIDVFIDYKNAAFFKELRFYNARKITWIHGSIEYLRITGIDKRLPMYDKIVGLTDAFVTDFRKTFPDLADRVLRIYNPINVEQTKLLVENAKRYPGAYFCQVSRLDEKAKDVSTLVSAFDKFYRKSGKPDVRLLIIGDGPSKQKLKNKVALLESKNNIVFVGMELNPFGYIDGALATVLSSKIEGLPTVLLEAMSIGSVCVASDCNYGPRELLLNGNAGILFEMGDINQLANIMKDIYNGKLDASEMIKNALKSMYRFEPNEINKQIMDLL